MTVGEGEVGWVVRHGVPLRLDTYTDIRQREVGIGGLCDGYTLDGVALMLIRSGIQRILQFHIRVQRIILRATFFLGDGIVKRSTHFRLIREEFTQINIGGNGIGLVVFHRPLQNAFLQSTEACRHNLSRHIERTNVGQLHIQCATGGPSALAIGFHKAQLVHPYLTGFLFVGDIAHTYHHGFHFTQ